MHFGPSRKAFAELSRDLGGGPARVLEGGLEWPNLGMCIPTAAAARPQGRGTWLDELAALAARFARKAVGL